ncbi:MAG: TolC family protein, partial [Flavobacteriaceae bacterium]
TQVYYHYDQNNLSVGNLPLNVLGIQQDFLFPTVYFAGRKVNKASYDLASSAYEIRKKGLERDLTAAFYKYQYTKKRQTIYDHLDSLYQNFAHMAKRRFELGETNYLEKITASSKQRQVALALTQAKQEANIAKSELLSIIQIPDSIIIADIPIGRFTLNAMNIEETVEMQYFENNQLLSKAKRKLEVQKLLPDISFNYFQGTNSTVDGSLNGYQAGLKIPLLFGGNASQIKAAKIAEHIALEEAKDYKVRLNAKILALRSQLKKYDQALTYYEEEGTALSDEILKTAHISFKNGEIDFFQYIQSLQNAYEIKLDYLVTLNEYNQTVIQLNYLTL